MIGVSYWGGDEKVFMVNLNWAFFWENCFELRYCFFFFFRCSWISYGLGSGVAQFCSEEARPFGSWKAPGMDSVLLILLFRVACLMGFVLLFFFFEFWHFVNVLAFMIWTIFYISAIFGSWIGHWFGAITCSLRC